MSPRVLRVFGVVIGASACSVALACCTPEQLRAWAAQKAVQELAKNLDAPDLAERARKIVKNHDSFDISSVFVRPRAGGMGTGALALSGFPDGVEGLVNYLRRAVLDAEKIEAHRDELLRIAGIIQAMSELAPHRMPHRNPSERQLREWTEVSALFKTTAREFRAAIAEGNLAHIREAATHLHHTCCHCHGLL